jgi:hypothetical protein
LSVSSREIIGDLNMGWLESTRNLRGIWADFVLKRVAYLIVFKKELADSSGRA